MDSLPKDMMTVVFGCMRLDEMGVLARVCKGWCALFRDRLARFAKEFHVQIGKDVGVKYRFVISGWRWSAVNDCDEWACIDVVFVDKGVFRPMSVVDKYCFVVISEGRNYVVHVDFNHEVCKRMLTEAVCEKIMPEYKYLYDAVTIRSMDLSAIREYDVMWKVDDVMIYKYLKRWVN